MIWFILFRYFLLVSLNKYLKLYVSLNISTFVFSYTKISSNYFFEGFKLVSHTICYVANFNFLKRKLMWSYIGSGRAFEPLKFYYCSLTQKTQEKNKTQGKGNTEDTDKIIRRKEESMCNCYKDKEGEVVATINKHIRVFKVLYKRISFSIFNYSRPCSKILFYSVGIL